MAHPLREGYASYHCTPLNAVQFLARMESSAASFSIQSKNVTVSALLFLSSGWSPGWWSQGMKSTGRTVWENLPSMASCLASWSRTLWLVCRTQSFELWDACVSGFVVPRQEGWKEMLCVSPNSAPRLTNSPWPLTFGGCLVRPMLTPTWDFGTGPLAGRRCRSSLSVLCVTDSSHERCPPPLLFHLSASFSVILWVPSRMDWKWERELKNLYFKKQRYFLPFARSWIRGLLCGPSTDQEKEWPPAYGGWEEARCSVCYWVNYLAYVFTQMQLEMLFPSPVYLFSEGFILNLISVFITETEDEMCRVSYLMFIYYRSSSFLIVYES